MATMHCFNTKMSCRNNNNVLLVSMAVIIVGVCFMLQLHQLKLLHNSAVI